MMADPRIPARPKFGLTVDSDWRTTVFMAALFLICSFLLAWEIYDAMRGHITAESPLHRNYFSVFDKSYEVIAAIICFVFASGAPKRSVKIASVLMGVNFAGGALLSCFHLSQPVKHMSALGGTILRQVALVIFCVAIAEWFRSVLRTGEAPEPPDAR